MTATASPSPAGLGSYNELSRHPSAAQLASRGQLSRPTPKSNSPIYMASQVNGASSGLSRKLSLGDSSDEDIPLPMKFSALTKALLNDEPSVVDVSSPSGRSAPSRDGAQSGRGSPDDRGCQGQQPPNPSTKGRN